MSAKGITKELINEFLHCRYLGSPREAEQFLTSFLEEAIEIDLTEDESKSLLSEDNRFTAKEIFSAIVELAQEFKLDLGLIRNNIFKHTDYNISEISDVICNNIIAVNHFVNPDWNTLAGRVFIYFSRKFYPRTFSENIRLMKKYISEDVYDFVMRNESELNNIINHDKDYYFDMVGAKTLAHSYQTKARVNGKLRTVESIQYMILRNNIHHMMPDLDDIKYYYNFLSDMLATIASPNYFNAGTKEPNTGSCYLIRVNDNTPSITKSWSDGANISRKGGGLGIDFSPLRCSEVSNTGLSAHSVVWLQIMEFILKAFNQGGRRKGNATAFQVCWHKTIESFLEAKKTDPPIDIRAPDLFYAMTTHDLFIQRAIRDEEVTLFSPDHVPGLNETYGETFEKLYLIYEKLSEEGKIQGFKIRAREIFLKLMEVWQTHGTPFIFFKDNANRKSNQSNIGVLTQSNLCMEITEVTSNGDIAACNLASMSLPKYIVEKDGKKVFDVQEFRRRVGDIVIYLNRTIDRSYYFTTTEGGVKKNYIPEIKRANLTNRPLGIGVQGLADLAAELDIAWTLDNKEASEEMRRLNKKVFSNLYYSAVDKSVELAKKYGAYKSFKGSPASYGLFQYDLWTIAELIKEGKLRDNDSWQTKFNYLKEHGLLLVGKNGKWQKLRERMVRYGLRNSLLIALMPTANTAHIMGNNECFEMFSGAIYTRKLLSGQFQMINKHLYKDLCAIGLWIPEVVKHIMSHDSIDELPSSICDSLDKDKKERLEFLKKKYMSIYKISQKIIIDLAADRGRYVCQSQSLNIHLQEPDDQKMWSIIKYANDKGLKTLYYVRTLTSSAKDYNSGVIDTMFLKNRAKTNSGEDCVGCVL